MQNNLDVIRGIYSAFARGDVASVLAALMPEIVWIEAEGFPSAGTYTTPDAVLHNVFMRLATEWDAFSAAPHEYVCDRQSVVAIGDYAGTYKSTGKAFKAPFAHVWKLRGGWRGRVSAVHGHRGRPAGHAVNASPPRRCEDDEPELPT